MRSKHLVFYDGECGLCDHAVQFLLKRDTQEIFIFAPLQGKTAQKFLKEKIFPKADSLVLIENYQTQPDTYLFGKGALRICWLLGGPWATLGAISFLPSFLYDWAYKIVARNRHRLFSQSCNLPLASQSHRFLD